VAKNTSAALAKFSEDYGYSLAFLKSDPELYKIFTTAVAKSWDATKFTAAVKNSNWYRTHGEAYRTNLALSKTDPATWKQQLASQFASISDLSQKMGGSISGTTISNIARDSLLFGWNDAQIRDAIAKTVVGGLKNNRGEAGQVGQQLKQTAYRNGVNISDSWMQQWQQKIAAGNGTVEEAQAQLRNVYGKALAPGFAKELDSGMDLQDIAQPYMQSMAQTLELNPADINLFDPTIRKALSSGGKDGGKTVPLWQFESNLKSDPRWLKTNNARDSLVDTTANVLKSFGLTS
jgi:hypothetical protein